jgi:branched-chain amino acid transport system ATP-binding protein
MADAAPRRPLAEPSRTAAIDVEGLNTFYGDSHVLHGLSLTADAARVTAVLGRNGVGKTTLVRSIMGICPVKSGTIRLFGEDVSSARPWRRSRAGLAIVPQGRHIFPSLTVRENIDVAVAGSTDFPLDRLLTLFPRLAERINVHAGRLSGGEQQMLAIARALRTSPKVVLMDEPSEGLAVQIVTQVGELVATLRDEGIAVVLVEQNIPLALEAADHVYVMARGQVVFGGDVEEFRAREDVQHAHLGV